jgi:NADH-quinone oxidoreductase subunit N
VVFVGKLAVFSAAWDGGFAWLVVLAAVNTVASLFYYLRWIAPAAGTAALPAGDSDVAGPGRSSGVAVRERVLAGPAAVVHMAAVVSLLLGVGSGVWLTVALPPG